MFNHLPQLIRGKGKMHKNIVIETNRIILRRWQEADLEPFISMNADSEVMHYFPSVLNENETKSLYEVIQQEFADYGYGLYATEEKNSGNFIGFIGFHWARFDIDFCPIIEIGWRLDKRCWGKGYATEGAKACLDYGFKNLLFEKIVSFTTVQNIGSQKVMQKIGMKFDHFFKHPKIQKNHPLNAHVLYSINKNEFR